MVSYTWDNNGDLTNRGSDSFAWDYEDRMTSATVSSVITTFAYRGDGLRNSRTTGGVTTTFTWDIAGGLPVVLDDGARYVYGAGLVSQTSGANTYYYLADGLGSTMTTVDATGAVVNGYTYDIYGKKTSSTGSQPNEFDFAGQQTDPTGLQYLRARYYDPETGTFVSRDPLADSSTWMGHPTSYVEGSPTNFTDPRGLRLCGSDPDDCESNPRLPDRGPSLKPLDTGGSRLACVPQCPWIVAAGTTVVQLLGEYGGISNWGALANPHGAKSLLERRWTARKYFEVRNTGNRAVNDEGNYVYFKKVTVGS